MATMIREFTYTLGANEQFPVNHQGRTIRCIQAAAPFYIAPGRVLGGLFSGNIEIRNGIGFTLEERFDFVRIINGGTAQTITVYIGDGDVQDSRFVGSVNALITPGFSLANGAHTALANGATDTIAGDSNRRAITVGVLSTAAGSLFAGESGNTDATHGVEIQPGMTFRFETIAAIDIHNASGAAVTYYTIEES